jgi:hypothetical protein
LGSQDHKHQGRDAQRCADAVGYGIEDLFPQAVAWYGYTRCRPFHHYHSFAQDVAQLYVSVAYPPAFSKLAEPSKSSEGQRLTTGHLHDRTSFVDSIRTLAKRHSPAVPCGEVYKMNGMNDKDAYVLENVKRTKKLMRYL